jgi:RNA polymerase sigma factor (sigma-70 family)
MTGDLATAEDVVQDAFERLHRGWRGLRQPASSLAYVRSSVLNGCRSVHRRARVARRYAPRLAERQDAAAPDPLSAADDRGELAAALRLLPRRQREVLVLRYYLDLGVAEISRTLRITPSAVRATNSRGLAALARLLGEERP